MNNIIHHINEEDLQDNDNLGIDIFSGAGGLSLGAEMAGIRVHYAIEINKSAAKTFRRNHKGVSVICEDITKLSPKDIVKDHNVFIIMGGDHLVRGSLCQIQ